MSPIKRRKLLVEHQVQGALGFRIAGHWLVFLIATISVTTALRVIGNMDHVSNLEIAALALREQAVSIVVVLALLPWFIHDALKLSNRFAGPIVRLRSALRQLSGDESVAPIKFREGDFWAEVAGEYNQLRTRVLADRVELRELKLQREQTNPILPPLNAENPIQPTAQVS